MKNRISWFTLLVVLLLGINAQAQNGWGSRNIGIGEVSVIEIAQNGDIWMGSNGGGMAFYDADSSKWSYYNSGNTPALDSDTITALSPNILAGVEHTFVGTTAGVVDFSGPTPTPLPSLPGNDVKGIVYRPDSLWVLTGNQFTRYDSSLTHQTDFSAPIADITCVQRTAGCAGFWAGTANNGCFKTVDGTGYLYLDTTVGYQKLVDNRINAVAIDGQCNGKFVGTKGGFSVCPIGSPCQNFTTANGLPQNDITTVATDCKGNIWLGTRDSGVVVFTPPSTFTRITTTSGLPDNDITYIAFVKQGPGNCKAYVASKDGNVAVLDTARNVLEVISAVPAVQREQVDMVVYPQPASGQLSFRTDAQIPLGQIVLTDVAGKVMATKGIAGGVATTFDVSGFAQGIYLYKLYSGSGVIKAGRVVVTR